MSGNTVQTMVHPSLLASLPPGQQSQFLQRAIQGNMAQLTQQAAASHAQQLASAMAQQQAIAMYQGGSATTFSGLPITTSTNVPPGSVFITTVGNTSTATTSSTTALTTASRYYAALNPADYDDHYSDSGRIKVPDGRECKIELPDGTVIDVKADGSFTIEDKDAKVIYRAARMRDFNPFINVSDRMEDFIKFCGDQGVRQGEMLELPLKLFIGWLVLQAAKHDNEPEPEVRLLPDLRRRVSPKCPGCGRFVRHNLRAKQIEFCAPVCFDRHFARHVPLLQAAE